MFFLSECESVFWPTFRPHEEVVSKPGQDISLWQLPAQLREGKTEADAKREGSRGEARRGGRWAGPRKTFHRDAVMVLQWGSFISCRLFFAWTWQPYQSVSVYLSVRLVIKAFVLGRRNTVLTCS